MSRLRLVLLAFGALALCFGLAACGEDDGDGGTAEITGGEETLELTIGDSVPLSGDLNDFGEPGQKAADLAIEEINAAVEEVGADHTVEIIHEDNETNPQAAVQVARAMVDDGASCIAGAWASSDSIPTARSVSIREGVLQISPASTSTELTELEDDGLFARTPPADNLQGPALASFVEEEIGSAEGKVVAVAGRNDSYGEGLTGYFIDAWEAAGGEIAGGEALLYDPEQPSYNSEAQELVAEDPDAYVIVDFPETFLKVGPALARTDEWDPAKTFITDGLMTTDLAAGEPEFTDGLRGTAPGTPEEGESSEAFDQLWNQSDIDPGVDRQTFDAQNFDAVILCYLAAVAAGSTEGTDMAAVLQTITGPGGDKYTWEELPQAVEALQNGDDIDYVGASGEIDLDENGDPTVGVYDQLEFKNGKIVPLGKQIPAEELAE
jgi:ABC-type branched-subunit amino acid transport system substrate-binding protein